MSTTEEAMTIQHQQQESVDFSPYPPFPIVWAYSIIDTVCDPLGCSSWRYYLPNRFTSDRAWLSQDFKVPKSIFTLFPPFMTYQEFLQMQTNQLQNQQQYHQPSYYALPSLRQYAFETPSTSLADLTTYTSIGTLTVLVCLLRFAKSVAIPYFSNFGRKAARLTHGPQWEVTNQVRIQKFGEYVFRLIFHSSISVLGIYLFWNEPWWEWLSSNSSTKDDGVLFNTTSSLGTRSLFMDYPFQPVKPSMIWYYLVQAAYNIEAMVALLELSLVVHFQSMFLRQSCTSSSNRSNNNTMVGSSIQCPIRITWSDTVRGDFREMLMHHIVTNLLVIGSSFFRFTRVGSMVFLVHDISDVPVDLSKLANFLKWKATTATCFAVMVLFWMLTRLIVLPFVIYRSVLYESWWVCANGYIPPIYHVMYQPIFVVLIGLLILLHFIWFSMMVRMGYYLVSKGEAHDLTEHKKGETQPLHDEPTNSTISNGKHHLNGISRRCSSSGTTNKKAQ